MTHSVTPCQAKESELITQAWCGEIPRLVGQLDVLRLFPGLGIGFSDQQGHFFETLREVSSSVCQHPAGPVQETCIQPLSQIYSGFPVI